MKIKIVKCSNPTYWYSEFLCEEFVVEWIDTETNCFLVRNPIDGYINIVEFRDAEILNRSNNLSKSEKQQVETETDFNTLLLEKYCKNFNKCAGKTTVQSWKDIQNQVQLINEEVKETVNAATAKDMLGVLDGLVDVLVTAFGLKQQLESIGVNVDLAMKLIAENNMSKFTKSLKIAEDTVRVYGTQGVTCHIESVTTDDGVVYCVKDSNNKVRKPVDYKSVTLSDCLIKAKELPDE